MKYEWQVTPGVTSENLMAELNRIAKEGDEVFAILPAGAGFLIISRSQKGKRNEDRQR